MNVRFFAGSKSQYLDIAKHNPIALYFCHDTRELFWGDKLLSDGIRIVATEADLPSLQEAADGIIYHVEENHNGYALSADRSKWIQVIQASGTGNAIKAISFAGTEMEEVDGVFTLDRRCAREALGFIVPEGMENEEIAIATEDFVRSEIAKAAFGDVEVNLENYYTKDQTDEAIAEAVSGIEVPKVDLSSYATKEELSAAIDSIEHPTVDLTGYATEQFVNEAIAKIEVPNVDSFITMEQVEAKNYLTEVPAGYATEEWVNEQGYLKEHQDLSEYAKKSDIPETEIYKVDFNAPDFAAAIEAYNNGKLLLLVNAAPDANGYAVMNYVRADLITFTKFLTSRSEAYGSFNTYYLHSNNTWELSKEVKLNKVEANTEGEAVGELTSIRIGKEIYNIPSTDGLATEQFVNDAIAAIKPSETPDLAEYVTETELAEALTKIEHPVVDLAGYATEEYVDDKIASIDIKEPDLSDYAKLTDLENFITKIPDEYLTEQELIDKNYLTEQSLADYATKTYVAEQIEAIDLSDYAKVDDIPEDYLVEADLEGYSKFSGSYEDLSNKPEIPSIDGLATEKFVAEAIAGIEFPEVPEEFVTEAELDAKGYLTNQSLDGFATETFVKNAIAEAELNDKEVNLSDYATKDDLNGLASTTYVDDAISNIEIPSVPTKVSELENDSGYLTEHQDISGKADIAHKHVIADIEDYKAPDLSNFALKSDLEGVATETFVDQQIAAIDLSGYAKAEDIPTDYLVAADLEGYSKFSGSYNDLTDRPALPSVEGLASEEYVNQAINSIDIPSLDGYAKAEDIPDVSGFISKIPDEYITEEELNAKGYLTDHQDISGKADKEHTHSYNELTDCPEIPSIEGLATEQYVQAEIDKIEIPEVDTSNLVSKAVLTEELAKKANDVPFTTDKLVTIAVGGFAVGDTVKGLTVAQILAKLLGLDAGTTEPDQPEIPEEPTTIPEQIIATELAMYSVNMDNDLAASDFEVLTMTSEEAAGEPTKSCFYQIVDNGEVIESGYQELQILNDETYYVIALPNAIDYDTMIELQGYDSDEQRWCAADKLPLTSDPALVAAICDEAGIDISHIDTELYTVWALEDTCTGKKMRYIIKEVN